MFVPLSPFVKGVKEFQQLGFMNKAVLDVTAVDVPLITLAKNQTEREERLLRQALILLLAFVFSPLHARLISRLFARNIGLASPQLNRVLMQLPFKALKNTSALKEGVASLLQHHPYLRPKRTYVRRLVNEGLRKRILNAKTSFIMADLATCGFLFASVGFVKVMFGKLISGKSQFTGEFGIVEQKTLDKLYEKEAPQKVSRYKKEALTYGLAIVTPILMGLGIRAGLKRPDFRQKAVSGTMRFASWLDYNYPQYLKRFRNWPLISDGMQIVLSLLLTGGELASARSKREFKELAIQRNSIDALFFLGAPALMRVIAGATSVQGAIDVARQRLKHPSPKILKGVATRAAWTYLASYVLAGLGVAGIIAWTNRMTRQAVKIDAAQLGAS